MHYLNNSFARAMAGVAESFPDVVDPATLCLPQPVHTNLRGLETVATYNHANMDVLLALLLTATVLFWFAWYVRFSQRAKGIQGLSLLRLQVFYYCIGVGIFGVVRGVFDTGRFLLACAAFHNLMEWGYFFHRWVTKETASKLFVGACLYIWLIITSVTTLLPLKWAVLVEQTLGIMCDYFLVFSFAWAYFQHRSDATLAPMWRSAWVASMLHFFQIYPLVIGTILGPCHSGSHWIEWLLTSGSVPCFYFYTNFALRWDEIEYGTTFQPFAPAAATTRSRTLPEARRTPYQAASSWDKLILLMFIGMCCGLVTIGGPAFLPRCSNPTAYPCPTSIAAAAKGIVGAAYKVVAPHMEL
ncbi:hypothetical protein WJX72_004822 [[Myrmecia] bisecta]|uniref:Uncharacterized protein n=1 Tax=[Myrmecia] bisecta TaxID=41462 RepID=A0AAW1QQI7_9CHLO